MLSIAQHCSAFNFYAYAKEYNGKTMAYGRRGGRVLKVRPVYGLQIVAGRKIASAQSRKNLAL